MRRFGVLVLIGLLVAGCTTSTKMKNLKPGMSQEEVIATLGNPTEFKQRENKTIFVYTDCYVSEFSGDKTDFYFVFADNKLIESGHGDIRQFKSNVHTIFFWPVTYQKPTLTPRKKR